MKTQILKSLFFFFLQIPAFCICSNAQIIYTDIIPDKTCNTDGCTYNLDLNNDGIIDFTIDQTASLTSKLDCNGTKTIYQVNVIPVSGNATLIAAIFSLPAELTYGDLINSDSIFQSGGQDLAKDKWNCFMGGWQEKKSGAWISGAADKYLGLRISIDHDTLYGWARLDVGVNGTSFTIKDYAYNSIPNQPILAGQTCPPEAIIVANGSTTFCAGDSVILSSANTGTNLSYVWKLNGTNISGATNKSYTAKTAGKYRVEVTDNTNNCNITSTAIKVKVSCKSFNDPSIADSESIISYPNPFSKSTLITFNLALDENVSLKIYDVEGKLTRTLSNVVMKAGVQELIWDGRDENGNEVNAGIYLLKMQTANESETIRLSVIK